MTSDATTVNEYIDSLSEINRKEFVQKFRDSILNKLPEGFEEGMNYGMIGYYVPHSIYPKGYHCNTSQPLPFMGLASQKNSVNFYHMGIYADTDLLNWFVEEFKKCSSKKLDMGKSCIRFKKVEDVPFHLIEELVSKISVEKWISMYEKQFKK